MAQGAVGGAGLGGASPHLALEDCTWPVRLLPELAERALVPAPAWMLPPEQGQRLMFAAGARHFASVAGPAGTLLVLEDVP